MRSAFSDVIGNERLRTRLCADLQENALAHAYVIEGDPGTGKHLLALRIAMAMSCEHRHSTTHPLPCLQCPSCRKIASGNSPDVIYVTREEKHAALGVNPIRDLSMDVYVAPNDLAVKTYEAKEAAYTLGVGKDIDPFMTLSFMSLPVIPTLRLTTRGVIDVNTQQYV